MKRFSLCPNVLPACLKFSIFIQTLVPALVMLQSQSAWAFGNRVVATNLEQPIFLTAPLNDERLFVVEKTGKIQVILNGVVQSTPFLDLTDRVGTQGEQGLLGLAFDPNYASNGRFYVNYIDRTTGNTVVSRYTHTVPGANVANPGSEERLLTIPQPAALTNHKAGWIGFRPGDAKTLYIATGDGGGAYDPLNSGQDQLSLLGKILRIDVSGTGSSYTIPTNNPFSPANPLNQGPGFNPNLTAPEIWALGVRNPFRNSFDRQTGDFWIADVGQEALEEINFELASTPGGRNYGWRLREGSIPTPCIGSNAPTPCVGGTAPGLTDPIFEYTHPANDPAGLGSSIIGGYVYRGPSLPEADGRYFFGDFVSNRVFSLGFSLGSQGPNVLDLREDTTTLLGGTGLRNLASFGEDGLGNLYLVGFNGVVVQATGAVPIPEPASTAVLFGLVPVYMATKRRWRSTST